MAGRTRALHGRVVAITGGARGIGATTAAALVAGGARVALGDLDADLVAATARDLGGDTTGLPLDVTDHAGFTAFLDDVERRLGPIDVLINNAGIMSLGLIEDEADGTTAKQIAVNLAAVIHGTREAVRRMKPRGHGHIVNVASIAGKFGEPGGATYCATKHGVVGLSEAVRGELRGSGVDISVVMPTVVRTELAAGLKDAGMVKAVGPEAVAEAIVAVVRRPRFEVWVPRNLSVSYRLGQVLPRAVGEWVARFGGADQVFTSAAHTSARTEYEARAERSAPGADVSDRV